MPGDFKHLARDHAHGFTHQKGLSYQIFELEDSGLPQQGILPISARKTITMATDVCLEKDSPYCGMNENCKLIKNDIFTSCFIVKNIKTEKRNLWYVGQIQNAGMSPSC